MNPAERRPVAGGDASPKRPEQRLQSLAFEDAFGAPDVGRVLSDMHFFLAPAAGGKCLQRSQCLRIGCHRHQQAGRIRGKSGGGKFTVTWTVSFENNPVLSVTFNSKR